MISPSGDRIEAEVVGFAGESLYLMPTGDIRGLEPDARVAPSSVIITTTNGNAIFS